MASPRPSSQPAQLYRLAPRARPTPVARGDDCVVALKALSEDTRVRIIGLLIDTALDVGEISRRVGASPYNVSKHLRILREAGLLQVERLGRRHLYAVAAGVGRRAADGSVLNLGCCSFTFERPAHEARGGDAPLRPRRAVSDKGADKARG